MGMSSYTTQPKPPLSLDELVRDTLARQRASRVKQAEESDIDLVLRGEPDSHEKRAAEWIKKDSTNG